MSDLRQAAQQALEAWFRPHGINYVDFKPYMEALRAALAEPDITAELVEALRNIVQSLSDQDDEGLIEHADPMVKARAALATYQHHLQVDPPCPAPSECEEHGCSGDCTPPPAAPLGVITGDAAWLGEPVVNQQLTTQSVQPVAWTTEAWLADPSTGVFSTIPSPAFPVPLCRCKP